MVIADVTDKGVPAALFMALSRTLIRTTALSGRSPGTALSRANQLILRDSQTNTFVSTFYAALDTCGGKLAYANAGHNPPLWLQVATGELRELAARGIVLGLFYDIDLEEREISVAPGDLLVFYTDGVTEAMAVTAKPKASAQEVLEAIVQTVNTFTGNTPQSDDITLFVAKRHTL
jgi:sigma-B regulation protein RsbU (phosphoserine phosphatase)